MTLPHARRPINEAMPLGWGRRLVNSRWTLFAAALVFASGIIVLLYPVLAAPVGADDRYWYLTAPARANGSYLELLAWTFGGMEHEAETGRVATLGFAIRRVIALTVTDIAVATSTPIVVVQALMKLTLLALAVLACWALLRSLRSSGPDRALVRLSPRSVALVTLTTTALLAVGAQAHSQFRNGWTSYAPLTYVAVVVIIGTAAAILHLSRKAASGGAAWTAVAIVLAVIAGVALNITYELYYVAVPIVVLVLILQPIHTDRRVGRRAAWIVGGAFVAAFSAVFVAIRLWIASACADTECYSGTELELSAALIGTFARNVLGSVPGAARSELQEDLASVGWEDRMPGLVSGAAFLVALGLAAGFVYLWRRISHVADPLRTATDEGSARGEARLLTVMAIVPAAAGVGSALVMALSVQSQEVIDSIGDPYRNTMATWTLFAFAGAMLVRAATLAWSRRASAALIIGVGVAIAAIGAHALTTNLPALAASRAHPTTIIVDTIQWETVVGDLTPAGDERRCQSLEALADARIGSGSRNRITSGAEAAFQHYHGRSYCSTGTPDAT